MARPCDWEALARAFERRTQAAVASRGGQRAAAQLRELRPGLHDEIAMLREAPWPVACWGQSRNFDDNAKLQIVAPAALRAIGWLGGVSLPARVCHSGLLHTYGYLFSTIDTPFGKKRDRWIDGAIERGLSRSRPGLRGLLRPQPTHGTLLHNVTWLLARLAFRDDDAWLRRLNHSYSPVVAESLRTYDYDALHPVRLTESVRLADRRLVELHTELVPFGGRKVADARAGLLVYWCRTRIGKRLLTAFPVGGAMQRDLVATAKRLAAMGRPEAPETLALPRYNAVVDGFDAPRPARRVVLAQKVQKTRKTRKT